MDKKIVYLLVVMGLMVSLLAVDSEKAEAFKGTLKIAHIADYSGPAAKSCREIRDGVQDYVHYINEERGGISGYKLEVENYDMKLDPALAIPAFKRYADELKVKFIYSEAGVVFPAIREISNEKKCVVMCMSGTPKDVILSTNGDSAGEENYYFIHTPTVVARMSSALEVIKKDWVAKGKNGVPKIGTFNVDHEAGHMTTTAARIYTQKAGFKWVGATFHKKSLVDAISQVATLKRWGADYVLGAADYDQPLTVFVKELVRMNYHPTVMTHTCLGTAYLETLDPAFEGHMSYQYCLDWPDSHNPEVALMHELNKKFHPKVKVRPYLYVSGWHGAMIFCEALRRAVETYGAENLTGQNIKKAFETLEEFDMNGLSGPISYNGWDHQGNKGLRWTKCEAGKLVPVGGFYEASPLSGQERDYNYWLQD